MKSREILVFLWGGGVPSHASDLKRGPPWGLSVPVSLLILLFLLLLLLLLLCRVLYLSGLMALPLSTSTSVGEGGEVVGCFLLLPLSPFPSCPRHLSLPSSLCLPVPWLLGYVDPVVGVLPGFGHYVGRPLALSL